MSPDVEARFWSKVDRGPGCWIWKGTARANGYGNFWLAGRTALAHRVALEIASGPIPEGLQVDHLCRVTLCVRPEHLEAVTPQVNTLRSTNGAAQNAQKGHCKRGHAFDDENTALAHRAGRIERRCRACGRAKEKLYRARKALRAAGVAA